MVQSPAGWLYALRSSLKQGRSSPGSMTGDEAELFGDTDGGV